MNTAADKKIGTGAGAANTPDVSQDTKRRERRPRRAQAPREEREFAQRTLELKRVTRVMAGGKRMRFRAAVVIGDRKGRVGLGVAKGADVAISLNKAAYKAAKQLVTVPIVRETIPHETSSKFGAAKVLLKPAPKGTGVKAGGAMRVVLDLAGVPNVIGKIMGSKSKINTVRATMQALERFAHPTTTSKIEGFAQAAKERAAKARAS